MPRNSRRNSDIQSTIKDYIVPIVGWIILLIIIISFFRWWDDSTQVIDNENQSPTSISFSTPETQAVIRYPGNSQETASESTSLYKWETIIVKQWVVGLTNPEWTNIALNKIAELKYNEDGSYSLYSSDAWLKLAADTTVSMRYANITWTTDSVISLTQNEAGSTAYVLLWSAKVSNLEWVSTNLIQWQKISVSRLNAWNKDFDIASEKWAIDSYFKGSDWFIENDGYLALEQATQSENEQETGTWVTEDGKISWDTGNYISFNRLRDEMSLDTASFNISGTINDENVTAISFDNKSATINTDNKTFNLPEFKFTSNINDIVVKIYDSNKNILEKNVITVYTSASIEDNSSPDTSDSTVESTPEVPATPTPTSWGTTFDIDATKFSFTEPSSSNKFSTTGSEITIRWKTSAEWISKVTVNWFELSSFNGSTWRYHAFERFETLEEWTNQYRVDYYGPNGSIVYTDYYTIVKSDAAPAPQNTSTTSQNEAVTEEDELFAN